MGYSSFKGLIACFPEVYLRFKGLVMRSISDKIPFTPTSFRRFCASPT